MNFRSEFGEDKWIVENCELPASGFYLDIGCADPVTFSNTAFLRDRGWSGIAIDGNPIYAPRWGKDFVNAVVSNQPSVEFACHECAALSRVEQGAPTVKTISLGELLRERKIDKVDFMSIDVEGHEFEVIQTLNLAKWTPQLIVSEFNTQGLPLDYRVYDYLLKSGYRAIHRTFSNFIFLRQ